MGCDIHAHAEIKVNGRWHHWNNLSINRNYWLFARMAGVRNSYGLEPIAEPRGLPTDVSFTTRMDRERWGEDGHSDSWLSAEEVDALETEWGGQTRESWAAPFGYIFGNGWDIKKYPDDYPAALEGARLVFWFDN